METAFNQPHVQITNCKEVKFINEKRLNNKLLSFQFIHTVLRTCDKTATTNTYISFFPELSAQTNLKCIMAKMYVPHVASTFCIIVNSSGNV